MPFGRGQAFGSGWSRGVDLVLGGWEFSPIFTAQTGLGLTINQPIITVIGGERRARRCYPRFAWNTAAPTDVADKPAGVRTEELG